MKAPTLTNTQRVALVNLLLDLDVWLERYPADAEGSYDGVEDTEEFLRDRAWLLEKALLCSEEQFLRTVAQGVRYSLIYSIDYLTARTAVEGQMRIVDALRAWRTIEPAYFDASLTDDSLTVFAYGEIGCIKLPFSEDGIFNDLRLITADGSEVSWFKGGVQ